MSITEYSLFESGYRDAPFRIEYRCQNCGLPAVGFGIRMRARFNAICPNLHVTNIDTSRPLR